MEEKQCLLVIIGATKDGKKELVALEGGFRESELSWTEVLVDLKHRGLKEAPELAVGDGALGFWKALAKVYDNTRWQRCWVHKIANVLNKITKSPIENQLICGYVIPQNTYCSSGKICTCPVVFVILDTGERGTDPAFSVIGLSRDWRLFVETLVTPIGVELFISRIT